MRSFDGICCPRTIFRFCEKGKRKLALNGFMYVRDKAQNGVTYWRCEDYLKCKSCVSTAANDSVMEGFIHNMLAKEMTLITEREEEKLFTDTNEN